MPVKDGRRRRVPSGGIHNLSAGFIVTLRRVNHPADSMRLEPCAPVHLPPRRPSSSPLSYFSSYGRQPFCYVLFFFFFFSFFVSSSLFFFTINEISKEAKKTKKRRETRRLRTPYFALWCVCVCVYDMMINRQPVNERD